MVIQRNGSTETHTQSLTVLHRQAAADRYSCFIFARVFFFTKGKKNSSDLNEAKICNGKTKGLVLLSLNRFINASELKSL